MKISVMEILLTMYSTLWLIVMIYMFSNKFNHPVGLEEIWLLTETVLKLFTLALHQTNIAKHLLRFLSYLSPHNFCTITLPCLD